MHANGLHYSLLSVCNSEIVNVCYLFYLASGNGEIVEMLLQHNAMSEKEKVVQSLKRNSLHSTQMRKEQTLHTSKLKEAAERMYKHKIWCEIFERNRQKQLQNL